MRYPISEETIRKTKKCDHDFACLDGNFENCSCSIDRYLLGNGIFLKENEALKQHCPYILCYGSSFSCHCPTRIELLQKHRI
ncbi:MAG: hypothetical protein HY807_10660 [Nitrospirae bacterium]|nr:hypothetical protein [Nitrospirota bacterium]